MGPVWALQGMVSRCLCMRPGLWLLGPGTALLQHSAAEADKSYLKSYCIWLGWRLGGVVLCCAKSRSKAVCLIYLELNLN